MLPEPAPLFSSFSAPLWFRPFILSLRKNSFWEEKKSATLILQYKTTTIINEWMYKLVNTMRYFLIEKFKNFKKIVLGSKTDTGACFWLFRGVVKRTRIPGVLSYNEQWKSHNYKNFYKKLHLFMRQGCRSRPFLTFPAPATLCGGSLSVWFA